METTAPVTFNVYEKEKAEGEEGLPLSRYACFPTREEAEKYVSGFSKVQEMEIKEEEYVPFEDRPKEVPQSVIDIVRYVAWMEHARNFYGDILKVTRVKTWEDVEVIEVKVFDRVYLKSPDDYATVEVRYSEEGAHAIYGIRLDGTPVIYAD